MKKNLRLTLLATAVAASLALPSAPAHAFFKHHHKHYVHHHVVHHKPIVHHKSDPLVRDAQASLINLKYMKGKPDGVMGPMTMKAIRGFQKDHLLITDGKLTKETYNAIIKVDQERAMAALPIPTVKVPAIMPANSPLTPEVKDTLPPQPGLVGAMDQQYADPLLGGITVTGGSIGPQGVRTQELSSRYAKLDINENINGPTRRYQLTMNGAPILESDHQPSIIGISETYALPTEDVIILTTYRDGDKLCPYKHYLLTLADHRNELRVIGNCTHGYQARKVEDSVFITFPEVDDQRVAGATWRYESGDLEKL